jgi:hypothetical protein
MPRAPVARGGNHGSVPIRCDMSLGDEHRCNRTQVTPTTPRPRTAPCLELFGFQSRDGEWWVRLG